MAAENAHEILEETMDVIEDTLDLMEKKADSWLSSKATVATLGGVVGLAIGASAMYLLVAKKLEKKYQQIAKEEVASVKRRYSLLNKDGEHGDLDALAEKYKDPGAAEAQRIVRTEGYLPYDAIPPSGEPTTQQLADDEALSIRDEQLRQEKSPVQEQIEQNIFESSDVEKYWDWSEEKQRRIDHPDKPYVVTFQEFHENVGDYQQVQLEYYDEDGVLVDDKSKPIDEDDEEKIVGHANLLRFGHASNDPNVVYIQNNELDILIEVVRNPGSYKEQVLGFIEHSDRPVQRRFRNHD